jgi:hypothetical protein
MKLAEDALKSARILLEAHDHVGAANRAYYSIFYAARAAGPHPDRAVRGRPSPEVGEGKKEIAR